MLDLSSVLLQAQPTVVTTANASDIESIIAIITAIGALIGLYFTRQQQGTQKQGLRGAADFLKTLAHDNAETKKDLATLADVTYNMSPEEARQIVHAQNVRIAELEEKAKEADDLKIPKALDHI